MNSEFSIAIHSLSLLAICSDRIVTSEMIASSACVHPARVRKILSLLRKNGYIQSKEGAGGGFYLSSDPQKVTLGEIYRLTCYGTLKPKCSKNNESCFVGAHINNVLQMIMQDAEKQVEMFLKNTTISDVFDLMKQQSND